ncbi:hypothetical protein GCM10010174_77140 [Kutzneria viridogrisea]|uniref:Cadmium resistance protein CadD (Predicted permease) n=1 Tax=Kutzneria viridogrisea TaxID=47990 RepID=A0ABR6BNQ9_9PSEU|nr:cadmium resistance protein CadD (predicted permease) [Kutzneria viridogrisea]
MFRASPPAQTAVTIAVFLVLVAVWVYGARLLGRHPTVVRLLERVAHWLVPAVFVVIGLVILLG